jgi:hypothetical protein
MKKPKKKSQKAPEGTPGSIPLSEYRPQPDWLRKASEGPMPRDKDGKPQAFNAETGEWEPFEPP